MFVIIYFTKYSFCILNTVPCHTGILRHYGCVVFCHCFQLLNSWRTRPADRASLQGAISMVSSHNYCLPFSKCQDESCNRFFFPRDAMHSAANAVVLCLCPSASHVRIIIVSKHILKRFSPSRSPTSRVFSYQKLWQ